MHSRAAKRASSPSIDTDKSLKDVKPPMESKNQRPSILAIHQGAGVTKKSKIRRKTVLSARAKRRQEDGLDRAEAVMDKREKKIERSRVRAKTVQDRAKAWDELNKKIMAKKAKEEVLLEDEWVEDIDDENEMKDVEVEEEPQAEEVLSAKPRSTEAITIESIAKAVPLPEPVEEGDEIL